MKYTLTLVSLVIVVLAVNGLVETWIMYRETTGGLARAQEARAEVIARHISDLLEGLERDTSWVTRASATTLDQRRADYQMLLRQTPAVVSIVYVDGAGREALRVSREEAAAGSGRDLSADARVLDALAHRLAWGPVTGTGPDLACSLAIAHSGSKAGVTLIELSLKALAGTIDLAPLGPPNYAYVADAAGRVLAASPGAPVTLGGSVAEVPPVLALAAEHRPPDMVGTDAGNRGVIRAGVPVESMNWAVVVEQPLADALQPIRALFVRLAWLTASGLVLAILFGLIMARRMIGPIAALHAGAAEFAANRFEHRIHVRTGDELEELAQQFNRMADELAGSYARLEHKVDERTRDLGRTVKELKALEEIGRAIASSLDLGAVFATIVARAVELTHADAGAIFTYDETSHAFRLADAQGFPPSLYTMAREVRIAEVDGLFATFAAGGSQRAWANLDQQTQFPLIRATIETGFRSALVVALTGQEGLEGALVLYRKVAGDFPASTANVMQTFAHQSILAMHNARLFREIKDKSAQLEIANAHRTQFFANMSHELRTPLNAVLGYSELLADGLYGTMPDKALEVLGRIQANGKHLLDLINDVLDLTKMEAGALTLSLAEYSMQALVESVVASTESLARAKGLALLARCPADLPVGRADERRLSQVLLNLVGNAIKFTDEGSVTLEARLDGDMFEVTVTDTGPGIAPEDQARIFDDFQQVDAGSMRKKGGTGLGLSISRRLVALHGGTLGLRSAEGEGAVFILRLPVRVDSQRQSP